jgi:hypothetical protein
MKRDEFEAFFTNYRQYLREEVLRFSEDISVYRQVHFREGQRLDVMNIAPAFFQAVERGLFSSIILWADKLLDEVGDRGVFHFLTTIEHNRKWLTLAELQRRRNYPDEHWLLSAREEITLATIEAHRTQLRGLGGLESFRIRRDKFHGHFDKKYFFERDKIADDAPLRWSDFDEALSVMGDIINHYSGGFDGTVYHWNTVNINDLQVLLDYAARGMREKPSR